MRVPPCYANHEHVKTITEVLSVLEHFDQPVSERFLRDLTSLYHFESDDIRFWETLERLSTDGVIEIVDGLNGRRFRLDPLFRLANL